MVKKHERYAQNVIPVYRGRKSEGGSSPVRVGVRREERVYVGFPFPVTLVRNVRNKGLPIIACYQVVIGCTAIALVSL